MRSLTLTSDEFNAKAHSLADIHDAEALEALLACRNRKLRQAREFGAPRDARMYFAQQRRLVHAAQVLQHYGD